MENVKNNKIITILSVVVVVLVYLCAGMGLVYSDGGSPRYMESIHGETTSPMIIIDISLIFPTCILGGMMLLQKKTMGYIIPPVMLIFLTVIAVTVVGQTAFQMAYGMEVPIQQLVGYVGTFLIFGLIAIVINTQFMLKCWPKSK